jgi:hypothetical protein
VARRIKPTTILNDSEVRIVAREARRVLNGMLPPEMGVTMAWVEEQMRFSPLFARCRLAREQKGLTVKAAAAALKLPQYVIRDIDKGHAGNLRHGALRAYMDYLGLPSWRQRWARANPDLAARHGLVGRAEQLGAKTRVQRRAVT